MLELTLSTLYDPGAMLTAIYNVGVNNILFIDEDSEAQKGQLIQPKFQRRAQFAILHGKLRMGGGGRGSPGSQRLDNSNCLELTSQSGNHTWKTVPILTQSRGSQHSQGRLGPSAPESGAPLSPPLPSALQAHLSIHLSPQREAVIRR